MTFPSSRCATHERRLRLPLGSRERFLHFVSFLVLWCTPKLAPSSQYYPFRYEFLLQTCTTSVPAMQHEASLYCLFSKPRPPYRRTAYLRTASAHTLLILPQVTSPNSAHKLSNLMTFSVRLATSRTARWEWDACTASWSYQGPMLPSWLAVGGWAQNRGRGRWGSGRCLRGELPSQEGE